jgi:hypothetical protein
MEEGLFVTTRTDAADAGAAITSANATIEIVPLVPKERDFR